MDFASRYRILRRLGAGGMAEVVEAEMLGEQGFRRRVALKRILPGAASDDGFVRRFIDEARIASYLHHASIVGVLDFGVVDGQPYQVLEYVDGETLRGLLTRCKDRERPFPVDVALHACTQVAHALDHAHRACDPDGVALRIVHRDVSPQNILVSWDGDVKLADFGIAVARVRTEKTQAGFAFGKPGYMAPEQYVGGPVTPAADIFALGCVLHVLLADQSPAIEETTIAALLKGRDVGLSEKVPSDVAEIVRRAIRAQPSSRWPSAAAMAEALGEAFARRSRRDGRTVVCEWLREMKDPPTVQPAGRLDGLLSPLPPARAETGRTVDLSPKAEQLPATIRSEAEPARQPPRREGRVGAWIVAPVLASAVGLTAAWLAGGFGGARPLVARTSPSPTPEMASSTPALVSPLATPARTPTARPPPAATRVAAVTHPVPVRSPSPSPAATPASNVKASIAVGGPGVVKAEIWIDGKRTASFAPAVLDLPVGDHEVVLVTADGRRLGPRTAHLDERHTRLSPWRWIVD